MTPDAIASWVDHLPPRMALYARLARFDRPAGTWLLFWPCLMGAFLAPVQGWWPLWPLFIVGAVAMRSAGCIYNDIVDRNLDRQVARTASRPVASGAISVGHATLFLVAMSIAGLGVLLLLPRQAQIVALASLLLVAAYPFMKRITWWPQAWLGLTFNWGIPVGWAAAASELRADLPVMLLVYAAGIAWTLGYDSIYAAQDIEDDALVGVKSSARAMGAWLRPGVGIFYAATIALLALALWRWMASATAYWGLVPATLHFIWQVATLDRRNTASALMRFRSNQLAGALLVLPLLLAAFGAHA